jgi:hypothetical protein
MESKAFVKFDLCLQHTHKAQTDRQQYLTADMRRATSHGVTIAVTGSSCICSHPLPLDFTSALSFWKVARAVAPASTLRSENVSTRCKIHNSLRGRKPYAVSRCECNGSPRIWQLASINVRMTSLRTLNTQTSVLALHRSIHMH